jgi:uncharacterized protein YndB with AHSA1/START domain
MRLLLIILASVTGGVVVIGVVIGAIGAMLPRAHEVLRSVFLPADAAKVYQVISNREEAPAWRADLRRVEMLGLQNGRVHFREHGAHGSVTYEIVEAVQDRSLVTRIVDRNVGYSGSWAYVLTPSANGTTLTITERGDVSNVIFRFLSRFVFGHTKTIDTYLASLNERMKQA